MSRVSLQDVIGHFGSQTATAEAADRAPQAVSQWLKDGLIPESAARNIAAAPGSPWNFDELPVKPFRSGPRPKRERRAAEFA